MGVTLGFSQAPGWHLDVLAIVRDGWFDAVLQQVG